MSLRDRYEAVLWTTMDWLRITDSVRRKMMAAVAIQFGVAVGLFGLPFMLSGTLLTATQALLFAGATVAFVNTALIVQQDLIEPLADIEAAASRIADGHVDTEAVAVDQPDEVGDLSRSFSSLQSYLSTVSAQADALAEQKFDDSALDEPVPGPFGDSLDRMADNLETYTAEIETRSERLQQLVDAFEDSTAAAIDGDLTATIDPDGIDDNDEYSVVIERYNELLRTLQESLGETAAFAAAVSRSTDQVVESTTELDRAGDEIAAATDEIAAGADQQRDKLQTAVSEVNTLSATVEEIAASAEEVSQTAETASETATEGREEATETMAELDEIETEITDAADSVEALGSRIDEVDEIVSVITDIAEQTNLLALNASIEAARADGEGDGFAVVADEVKNLAEDTKDAAEEIADRLEEIQAQSDDTIAEVEAASQRVSESTDAVERSLRRFDEIAEVVTELSDSVHEISDATDQQAHSAEDVAAVVDEVATISDETADDAASAASAAEQQTTSLSNVSETVEGIASEADELESLLAQFDLDEEATTGDSMTVESLPDDGTDADVEANEPVEQPADSSPMLESVDGSDTNGSDGQFTFPTSD
ncbi:MAG: methyl-accepting chemotaxis protein [uncultured archaeon A07HN63]|nr:MAG: methyl-accepting chemotaxis protein [uncultured archaeon A07HN63]